MPSTQTPLALTWQVASAVWSFVMAWALSMVPPALGWARWACLFVWRHRVAAGGSLAAGLGAGVLSYLSGPAVSSVALAVCAAAFAVLPFTDLWRRLTGRCTAQGGEVVGDF